MASSKKRTTRKKQVEKSTVDKKETKDLVTFQKGEFSTQNELETMLLENALLKHEKLKVLMPTHEEHCTCGGSGSENGGDPVKVDLIVLMDTSGSMVSKAQAISDAADRAIQQAKKSCQVDLEVRWLGIAATFPETKFTKKSREVLELNECNDHKADQFDREEGADTITDLSRCAGIWRKGACRAIFYISDEPLNEGAPQNDEDTLATQIALTTANENGVKVFAHLAPGAYHENQETISDYRALCEQTGGELFVGNTPSPGVYQELLEKVICQACKNCNQLQLPEIYPCITLTWGDSECDCMETNDFEVLYIKACNCYNNIAFENLKIGQVKITDKEGNDVPNLPDGTPSIEILPSGPICFENLEPCQSDEPSCKARQVMIRTCGAIPGMYQVELLNISFQITWNHSYKRTYALELCKD